MNHSIKVLLIEGNPDDARLIQELLAEEKGSSFRLECVDRLSAGIERLASGKVDVILLGLGLPDSQGFDTFIKVHNSVPQIPIVILSGLTNVALAARTVREGAQDYLVKGHVDSNLLGRSLRYAIERKQVEEKLKQVHEGLQRAQKNLQESQARLIQEEKLKQVHEGLQQAQKNLQESQARLIQEEKMTGMGILIESQARLIQEEKLKQANEELQRAQKNLQESQARLIQEEKLKQANEELQRAYKDLQESQARLIQSEKMSAVGTLAAGTAHELNNPMMGILNFSQYCLKHTPEDDRRYTVLQDIQQETRRCIDIVQNLLTFSRIEETHEAYQKESCTVILERVLRLVSYRIEKQGISVTRHTADGTPKVWMKPSSIQQVFLNVIVNALDALEESEKKEISVDIRREGEFVQVTIADIGEGIAPENLHKVFDPFFTTKPAGRGTGLGLSVSLGIIEAHKGEITCNSEPGAGTKLTILLPIERKTQESAK